LYCEGETTVIERVATRNHTELAMQSFGVPVTLKDRSIQIKGNSAPSAIQTTVPGDISSGAFLIAAATLLPGSQLLLQDVGMNPGRRTFVDLLLNMGASIDVMHERVAGGEPIADLLVGSALLKGGTVSGELIPQVIDEIPILAVLATQTEIGMEIRDAGELRVKESDRIRSIVDNLRVMGGEVEELPDGLIVKGRQSLSGGRIRTYRDHRIAMAFAIAGLTAVNPTLIEEAECAGVSFPSFFEILSRLVN
jgi:3-phosphoshikimate 1-carboxyvinyltransferase